MTRPHRSYWTQRRQLAGNLWATCWRWITFGWAICRTVPKRPMSPPAELGGLLQFTGADWLDDSGAAINPERTQVQPGQTHHGTALLGERAADRRRLHRLRARGRPGRRRSRADGSPAAGRLHAHQHLAAWPGRQRRFHAARLPEGAAPGEYTVYTGLYDLATLERLPVTVDGRPAGDAVPIATLTVP